jgi:hypothetical protein
MAKSIEVFRDLNLRGSLARRSDLRQALITAAKDPWHHDPDRAAAISRNAIDAEILAFDHKATDDLRAAGLTLWSTAIMCRTSSRPNSASSVSPSITLSSLTSSSASSAPSPLGSTTRSTPPRRTRTSRTGPLRMRRGNCGSSQRRPISRLAQAIRWTSAAGSISSSPSTTRWCMNSVSL